MKITAPHPLSSGGLDSDASVPYAFERVQADGGGVEAVRLEAQNLLFEKAAPLEQLPPTPPEGSILDVGSGTGFWSQRLAARVPMGRVTCLDRSAELLELARARLEAAGLQTAEYLHQDLRCLDLPEKAFDLAFTSVTLAHVQELEPVLDAILASIKPGGWIACFEPVQQTQRFCGVHPPCPTLDRLMDDLLEVVEARGSDLSVALKIAHHLERVGMEATVLKNYGTALHGEDALFCIQQVFLPLVQAYLRPNRDPHHLDRALRAVAQEITQPHLWMDFRRSVVLARKP